MKRVVSLAVLLWWVFSGFMGLPVRAADDIATATSAAQFWVDPGALTLLAVPNLHFENGRIGDLIAGPLTLALQPGSETSGASTAGFDGTDQGDLVVRDWRGSLAGWQLTAQLGRFVNRDHPTQTLVPLTSHFDPVAPVGEDTAGIVFSTQNFSGQDLTLMIAPPDHGSGTTTVSLTGGQLGLPQTLMPQAGHYQAIMTWTLAATPG